MLRPRVWNVCSPVRRLSRVGAALLYLLAFCAHAAERQAPPLHSLEEISVGDLHPTPLPMANLRVNSVGGLKPGSVNPGVLLLKKRGDVYVGALRVEPGREAVALERLRMRKDVEIVELDRQQERMGAPNDPEFAAQWHHKKIRSEGAWAYGYGSGTVRIAIADTPFQMDHPDLAANADTGWDVVSGAPIMSSTGIDHSTMSAGMAAAVINNGRGVAGAANCRVLPINVTGLSSELCQAVYWAASNNVRVVSISWSGADSAALNAAAEHFRKVAGGLVVMSGVNGLGFLDYPAQPDIWCVSMTDAADNAVSRNGDHIDFAAPGHRIYSTGTNGRYLVGDGTSYSTPLVAGIMAQLWSMNPTLSPEEVTTILKETAVDRGEPGWDMWFGWGRVDFAAAVAAAQRTLPTLRITSLGKEGFQVQTGYRQGISWRFLRAGAPQGPWEQVPGVIAETNGSNLLFRDPKPLPGRSFFQLEVSGR